MTHYYKRHGTTCLFVALKLSTGEVICETYKKHRHQEVLRFLKKIEQTVPKGQEIHIILDNYATHKHAKVMEWIEQKKRIYLHFILTSSSWLNLVERFFCMLTQKQLRRGVFCSGPNLNNVFTTILRSIMRIQNHWFGQSRLTSFSVNWRERNVY